MIDSMEDTTADNGNGNNTGGPEPEIKTETGLLDRRVYRYGCLAPKDARPVVDQMYLAHRYRIELTLIERGRRAAVRVLLPEDRKLWGAELRAHASEIAVIDERAADLRRGAREIASQTWGLYWGTYQLVEEAEQASRRSTPLYEDTRWPPWKGEGSVSVQIMKGMSPVKLVQDTQVEYVPDAERGEEFGTLRLRIGSTGRRPIWAEWPVRLHRPLPSGCSIKRVTVHRRLGGARTSNPRSGRRERWEVQFILEMPLGDPRCGSGVVGIDLGWRRINEELRVCAFADEQGRTGELRLPAKLIGGYRRVESLRKTRDDMRGRALALVTGLRDDPAAPAWFKKATEHAHAWRNPRRIPMFLRDWQGQGSEKGGWSLGEIAFAWLSYWLERDRHLWQWESDQNRKNQNGKRKTYEKFAATLAEQYETIVLEELDLRVFATRPDKDALVGPDGRKESQQEERARAWRHLAGTYQLRLALENAALVRGGSVCRVPAMNTTRTCSDCGLVVRRDFGGSVAWICDCGVVHDQDKNAGMNLCERFRALEEAGTARIRKAGKAKGEMKSRFVRAKEKKAQRVALAK